MENWDQWPLLEVSDGDPVSVTSALRPATQRQTPFAAVVVLTTSGPAPRGQEARARVRMLMQVRPGLRRWCRGLAFVLKGEPPAKSLRSADTLWGCPTYTTRDLAQARDWARHSLAEDAIAAVLVAAFAASTAQTIVIAAGHTAPPGRGMFARAGNPDVYSAASAWSLCSAASRGRTQRPSRVNETEPCWGGRSAWSPPRCCRSASSCLSRRHS
ncbi:hypothetical protein GCM10022419_081400 [Nonomuraea rosea]|uniref:Uncharacterized protein n=1 Tax=Nonomuraea rosea TaxID=638574 RepID=A0ABP6YMS9_9ACTN